MIRGYGDNLTNISKRGFAISGVDADAHRVVVVQVMHNGVSEGSNFPTTTVAGYLHGECVGGWRLR